MTDEGLCRVGWSTLNAKLDLGTDRDGFGFGGTGKKSFGRQFDSYGEVRSMTSHQQITLHVYFSFYLQSYGMADVIGSYIDLDTMSIKWSKNGVDFGKAYNIPQALRSSTFFPAVCLKVTCLIQSHCDM